MDFSNQKVTKSTKISKNETIETTVIFLSFIVVHTWARKQDTRIN